LNTLIIEDASLEILPRKYFASKEARLVTRKFGVNPDMQILDKNFHNKIIESLSKGEKRGRPDVVHLALLDTTSTPLFEDGLLRLFVRTMEGFTIEIKTGTRLPRTLQRFCGVMARLLSGRFGESEAKLFEIQKNRSFSSLAGDLKGSRIVALSSRGSLVSLRKVISEECDNEGTIWVVGGFPHGSFSEDVIKASDRIISISNRTLPAHVVTARLCYELEEKQRLQG
jgi:rRNA small subunit pseudouridine methyltransferase Nep1